MQQRHHDVLERGELPKQVMELEDEPDLPVPHRRELGLGLLAVGAAVETHRAARRRIERAEQVQQRALARSARADDGDELTPAHRQIDPGQDLDRAAVAPLVDLAQTLRLENGAHSWRIASTGVSARGGSRGIQRRQQGDRQAGQHDHPDVQQLDVHREVIDEIDRGVDPDPARLVHHVGDREPAEQARAWSPRGRSPRPECRKIRRDARRGEPHRPEDTDLPGLVRHDHRERADDVERSHNHDEKDNEAHRDFFELQRAEEARCSGSASRGPDTDTRGASRSPARFPGPGPDR